MTTLIRGAGPSFAYCERLTRRTARNFYPAFTVLPAPQRRAMCALYAFMRLTDDIADEGGDIPAKAAALTSWRTATAAALAGEYAHAIHPAFHATVRRHAIPHEYLYAVIDGVGMDLGPVELATFDDLYRYCYHVAGVVGLACIHIWEFSHDKAKDYAESVGVAFQLTNILRDLGEDFGRGRVYVPREELERFGCRLTPSGGQPLQAFNALMRFQVSRAREYYDRGKPLAGLLKPAGRAVFQVMERTYRGLLDRIESRGYDVFSQRVRLPGWRKLGLMLGALPVRWGWA
jgi:phytoene synthase